MSKNTNNTIRSQEEFEEEIRPDLEDISNTIKHLLMLGDYFRQKSYEWGRWWHDGVATSIYRKGRGDKEIIQAAEWAYREGAGTADALGNMLPRINSIKWCPRLKDYIRDIRDRQDNWIPKDRKQIARCKKIIRARKPLDYSDVEFMLEWHKKHLKILRDLDNDLAAIEESERYKIEEQKQCQKGQNATPAKIWTCIKRIPRWIYLIVGFLAALLTIFHYLGWLEPIGEFIHNILWPK